MSTDSKIPEQFLDEEYNSTKHPWFQQLNWKDDRKYYKFGKDKSVSHTVTRKPGTSEFKVNKKLKEASALARLVEKSR